MIVALAALVILLALASLFVSVYSLYCAQKMRHESRVAAEVVRAESAAAVTAATAQLQQVASQLQAAEERPPVEILPGTPRPGMNLSRRSHALRMHRKGAAAEQIAASLEVPRQEIDLLIKVHEIVLNNL